MQGLKAVGKSEPVKDRTAAAGKGSLQQVGCVRGLRLLAQGLVWVWGGKAGASWLCCSLEGHRLKLRAALKRLRRTATASRSNAG